MRQRDTKMKETLLDGVRRPESWATGLRPGSGEKRASDHERNACVHGRCAWSRSLAPEKHPGASRPGLAAGGGPPLWAGRSDQTGRTGRRCTDRTMFWGISCAPPHRTSPSCARRFTLTCRWPSRPSITAARCCWKKPPAPTLAEFEVLVAGAVGAECQVGFQSLGSAAIQAVRDALAQGQIGEVRGIGAAGTWVREEAYFHRSAWLGTGTSTVCR